MYRQRCRSSLGCGPGGGLVPEYSLLEMQSRCGMAAACRHHRGLHGMLDHTIKHLGWGIFLRTDLRQQYAREPEHTCRQYLCLRSCS